MPIALWTLETNEHFTAEDFWRFVDKVRRAGSDPTTVLQRFILEYINEATEEETARDKIH